MRHHMYQSHGNYLAFFQCIRHVLRATKLYYCGATFPFLRRFAEGHWKDASFTHKLKAHSQSSATERQCCHLRQNYGDIRSLSSLKGRTACVIHDTYKVRLILLLNYFRVLRCILTLHIFEIVLVRIIIMNVEKELLFDRYFDNCNEHQRELKT